MTEIFDILTILGIRRKYVGFPYLALAIKMVMENEEYLHLATKWLYPEIAKVCKTTWSCVERDMRTAIMACWKTNRAYLQELAKYPLNEKPHPIDFIDIIATHLLRAGAGV